MKPEDLDNLNRDELFAVIKGKCMSRAKRDIYLGSAFLILLILFLIWLVIYYPQKSVFSDSIRDGILYPVYVIVFCCLGGWIILSNYWFKKKIANVDTPDQLLRYYEKKERNNRLFSYFNSCAFMLIVTYPLVRGGGIGFIIMISALVVVLAVLSTAAGIYLGHTNRRDLLLEKLQDLVEEEQ